MTLIVGRCGDCGGAFFFLYVCKEYHLYRGCSRLFISILLNLYYKMYKYIHKHQSIHVSALFLDYNESLLAFAQLLYNLGNKEIGHLPNWNIKGCASVFGSILYVLKLGKNYQFAHLFQACYLISYCLIYSL